MHPLVAPVLLRIAGFDQLWQYPKAHPPSGEPGQPGQRVGGKRHTIVGADELRQSVLLEQPSKHRLCACHTGVGKAFAAEQEAAVAVGDG